MGSYNRRRHNLKMEKLIVGGTYQHYKGNYYKVIDLARHSETLEEMVIYECLYENDLGKIWARPKKMFLENVTVAGKIVPRFRLVKIDSAE